MKWYLVMIVIMTRDQSFCYFLNDSFSSNKRSDQFKINYKKLYWIEKNTKEIIQWNKILKSLNRRTVMYPGCDHWGFWWQFGLLWGGSCTVTSPKCSGFRFRGWRWVISQFFGFYFRDLPILDKSNDNLEKRLNSIRL